MPIIKKKEEIMNNKIGSPTGFYYIMGFKGLAPSNIILYSLFIILSRIIVYRSSIAAECASTTTEQYVIFCPVMHLELCQSSGR